MGRTNYAHNEERFQSFLIMGITSQKAKALLTISLDYISRKRTMGHEGKHEGNLWKHTTFISIKNCFVCFGCFETGFLCVALAVLELTL